MGVIDYNSVESRLVRGFNQAEFELEGLKELEGKSVSERFFTIRDAILGDFSDIHGDRTGQLIRDIDTKNYPRSESLPLLVGDFYRFVDEEHSRVSLVENPEMKSAEGFRLAQIVYLFGVEIHQSRDANGQTNKLIVLSYIHEFCPEFRDNFIPIKYSEGNNRDDIMAYNFQYNGLKPFVLPETMSDLDKVLYAQLVKMREIQNESMQQEIRFEDTRAFDLEKIDDLNELLELLDASLEDLKIDKRFEYFPAQVLENRLASLLEIHYPGFIFAKHPTLEKIREYFVHNMIGIDEGMEFLRIYLKTGDVNPELFKGSPRASLIKYALANLKFLDTEFRRVLSIETREKHLSEYLRRH